MRFIWQFRIGLVGVLLLAAAGAGSPGTMEAKSIKETIFPSGLRLLVKEAHGADLAAVQVWVRAGGYLEDGSSIGSAHVIEHLVFKGTESRAAGMIDQEIEDLGGELSAATEKDWTMYGTTVASTHALKVIDILGDALRNAKFLAKDLQAEKPIILEELAGVAGDPERLAVGVLFRLAFEEHPYARDARGHQAVLERLNVDSLKAYFQKYYAPGNMTVVVVGDVSPAAVEKHVRTAFAADAPATRPAVKIPPAELAGGMSRREVLEVPFPATFIGMAFPAPGASDQPDVYAMDVLVTMLENDAFGRLPAALRGKVGGVKATFETRRQSGLLHIVTQTDPRTADEVEKLLRDEIKKLRDNTPTDAEIAFTKRQLAGSFALDNETFGGQAGTLGFYASIESWQFATTYLERIQAVTRDQIAAAIKKYLDPARSVAIVLRPQRRPPGQRPQAPPAERTSVPRRDDPAVGQVVSACPGSDARFRSHEIHTSTEVRQKLAGYGSRSQAGRDDLPYGGRHAPILARSWSGDTAPTDCLSRTEASR